MSDIDIDFNNIKSVKYIGSRKEFSFLLFTILLIFTIIPALIYLIYFYNKDNDIFIYSITYNDNKNIYKEFKKKDPNLKNIQEIAENTNTMQNI